MAIISLAVVAVGALAWGIIEFNRANRYEEIVRTSCRYSGNESTCLKGWEILKSSSNLDAYKR